MSDRQAAGDAAELRATIGARRRTAGWVLSPKEAARKKAEEDAAFEALCGPVTVRYKEEDTA